MRIAAAQIQTIPQNTAANIRNHIRMIEAAAKQGVSLLLFPEMSLTGYELEMAETLAFEQNDPRLADLVGLAVRYKMLIIAGAPIRIGSRLYIGSFIFSPEGEVSIYTKQYLHGGEEKFFAASFEHDPLVILGEEKIALAICADITNPLHPEAASKRKATLYAAGIFYSTPTGIEEAYKQLSHYARKYKMGVLIANYAGVCYQIPSRGKSAYWDKEGKLIGELNNSEEALLVVNNVG